MSNFPVENRSTRRWDHPLGSSCKEGDQNNVLSVLFGLLKNQSIKNLTINLLTFLKDCYFLENRSQRTVTIMPSTVFLDTLLQQNTKIPVVGNMRIGNTICPMWYIVCLLKRNEVNLATPFLPGPMHII